MHQATKGQTNRQAASRGQAFAANESAAETWPNRRLNLAHNPLKRAQPRKVRHPGWLPYFASIVDSDSPIEQLESPQQELAFRKSTEERRWNDSDSSFVSDL